MQILTYNFSILTVGGVWRPTEWSSSGVKFLYNTFTFCIIISLYFLMITQFMDIVLIVDNMDDFISNSLLTVTVIALCCKATIVVIRRSAIDGLVEMLLKEPCKPRDEDEMAIQRKFDKFIKSWSIRYSLLATGSVSSITIKAVLDSMQGSLPYRVWLPYDSDIPLLFCITSIHQIITLIFVTVINVGTETLVFGLFLQTCCQLEIFENRLRKLVMNRTTRHEKYISTALSCNGGAVISEYIRHHLDIYKYARMVNGVFNEVLFVQFFGSILILCTSVYYISTHVTEPETARLLIYTICMFVQIYVYCWSGNEVILKSTNVGNSVYHMDWPLLSVNGKKDLLMVMKRSTIPIQFTSSFLITLSLQSYSNILKTSYSAFNVLQS